MSKPSLTEATIRNLTTAQSLSRGQAYLRNGAVLEIEQRDDLLMAEVEGSEYEPYQVRVSGSGGQGIITAGIILAEAASLYEGYNAVQTQSYGPESRGGATKSEVVISRGEIDYPKVSKCDVLLAMTDEACEKYLPQLPADGGR